MKVCCSYRHLKWKKKKKKQFFFFVFFRFYRLSCTWLGYLVDEIHCVYSNGVHSEFNADTFTHTYRHVASGLKLHFPPPFQQQQQNSFSHSFAPFCFDVYHTHYTYVYVYMFVCSFHSFSGIFYTSHSFDFLLFGYFTLRRKFGISMRVFIYIYILHG